MSLSQLGNILPISQVRNPRPGEINTHQEWQMGMVGPGFELQPVRPNPCYTKKAVLQVGSHVTPAEREPQLQVGINCPTSPLGTGMARQLGKNVNAQGSRVQARVPVRWLTWRLLLGDIYNQQSWWHIKHWVFGCKTIPESHLLVNWFTLDTLPGWAFGTKMLGQHGQ